MRSPPQPPAAERPGARRAFLAGGVAVLTAHQGALWLLHRAGAVPWPAYSLAPTRPLGVPAVWSAAAWGGVWGALLVPLLARPALRRHRWSAAFALGAVLPTTVGALLATTGRAFPLNGANPAVAGAASLLVNGLWGLATAALAGVERERR